MKSHSINAFVFLESIDFRLFGDTNNGDMSKIFVLLWVFEQGTGSNVFFSFGVWVCDGLIIYIDIQSRIPNGRSFRKETQKYKTLVYTEKRLMLSTENTVDSSFFF